MAFIPNKLDETQIAFLANEITKSYMTGKNISSKDDFAREYFNMYQKTMKIIAEEERKRSNEQADVQAIMDIFGSKDESPNSRNFR